MKTKCYLQQLNGRWYVRVKVPRHLQSRIGNTHVRRALGTSDLREANRLKWRVLAAIQALLERHQGHHERIVGGGGVGVTMTRRDAPEPCEQVQPRQKSWRLPERLDRTLVDATQTIDALVERWLADADYLVQTKQQHRHAWLELRQFLGGDRLPSVVTAQVAIEYVEEVLKRSGQAYATQRRKLNSLLALWEWMALRLVVPRGSNPWRGFRLGSKKRAETPSRTKRPYTEEELIRLFSLCPRAAGLADVMVLGLLTGMRLEEICALRLGDVRPDSGGGYWLHIRKAKTRAGVRSLIVSHRLGVEVISRRWSGRGASEQQLFPEFRGGGYDGKLSWGVSKAFGRHRTKVGLGGETDFHSFRRNFITAMENAGVDQVQIARYVGHELPTLAFTVYSGGSTEQTTRSVASKVALPDIVSKAVEDFLSAGQNVAKIR